MAKTSRQARETGALPTLAGLQRDLASGVTTAVKLTEEALARAEDPHTQGRLVFTRLYRETALAAARASDLTRQAGLVRSALEGIPISIKDLFDVAGETTLSGSVVLRGAPPAARDAVVVQRLRAAGAVITGKTNMVEFAFSGLGLNPHYGTPCNPWDRPSRRIPGGSSSGAAVAVADGFSVVSIGSDTGGSVRIPSALCGLTGFKPTLRRVSTQGVLPLSTTLDSIGGLAASVACCAAVDAILSGEARPGPEYLPAARFEAPPPATAPMLRLAIPSQEILDGADEVVRRVFSRALDTLGAAGIHLETVDIPEFSTLASINAAGGFIGAEAWAWHKDLLTSRADEYDPRVASRILRCRNMTAADYIELIGTRRRWIASVENRLAGFDAVIMPTVPIIAPRIDTLQASDEQYHATNRLVLRNSTFINFLDGCALSIPCHSAGEAPVGLMIAGPAMHDRHILNVGAILEAILARSSSL